MLLRGVVEKKGDLGINHPTRFVNSSTVVEANNAGKPRTLDFLFMRTCIVLIGWKIMYSVLCGKLALDLLILHPTRSERRLKHWGPRTLVILFRQFPQILAATAFVIPSLEAPFAYFQDCGPGRRSGNRCHFAMVKF